MTARSSLARSAWLLGWPVRSALLLAIWVYRRTLSGALGAGCRFAPSCSEYAAEAIRRHGAVRGTALAAWRVLRCSPLTTGGWDPVPEAPAGTRRQYEGVIHGGPR